MPGVMLVPYKRYSCDRRSTPWMKVVLVSRWQWQSHLLRSGWKLGKPNTGASQKFSGVKYGWTYEKTLKHPGSYTLDVGEDEERTWKNREYERLKNSLGTVVMAWPCPWWEIQSFQWLNLQENRFLEDTVNLIKLDEDMLYFAVPLALRLPHLAWSCPWALLGQVHPCICTDIFEAT